ncbi:TPA: hypothetical protein RLU78_003483 [Escherichia coli]|nr:hypothetical protein [Escherichia coli]HDW2612551.1 hypothetical protein [Escherichia coli]
MKKTLIALAVAASAAVSGSAMAWEANGTGGSVNIGGSLTPAENITPWEVKTGAAVTGLDADINKGQSVVNIAVDQAIPVLGIRTVSATAFPGQDGINPQIDFHGAIDPTQFEAGKTQLVIDVKADDGVNKIGSLQTALTAVGIFSWKNISNNNGNNYSIAASEQPGDMFKGGLSTTMAGGVTTTEAQQIAPVIFPGSMDNFTDQETPSLNKYSASIAAGDATYSAFYASGIEAGKVIKLTLDSPAQGDAPITWKASLPITVSYQ